MKPVPFIHLRVHSAYSLLEGAIHVKELVKWAKTHSTPAVAITDHGNLFGSLEFSLAAMGEGVQPIIGSIMYLKPHQAEQSRNASAAKPDQLLLLAQTEQGWLNLLHLVSKSYLAPTGGHAPILTLEDFTNYSEGLIALTSGI